MTEICYLKRGERNAVAAADGAVTFRGRIIDSAKKIYIVGNTLFSYAGNAAIGDEIRYRVEASLQGSKTPLDTVVQETKRQYDEVRTRRFIEGPLKHTGFSPAQWAGRDIPAKTLEDLDGARRDSHAMDCLILLGGLNGDRFHIYRVGWPGTETPIEGGYDSIGSMEPKDSINRGYERIGQELKKLENGDRENIPLATACKIILRGVQEGWSERGVGGKTQLVVFEDGVIRDNYTRRQTTFLHNLLLLQDKEILAPGYVDEAFGRTLDVLDRKKKSKFPGVVHDVVRTIDPKATKRSRDTFFNILTTTVMID